MLFTEDYGARRHLSPLQHDYSGLFDQRRQIRGLRGMAARVVPIDVLTNTDVAKPVSVSPVLQCSIVGSSQIAVLVLGENGEVARNGRPVLQFIASHPVLEPDGRVVIGGLPRQCPCSANFGVGPMRKGQVEKRTVVDPAEADEDGRVSFNSPRDGEVSICLVGGWIDVRVGEHFGPVIVARFNVDAAVEGELRVLGTTQFPSSEKPEITLGEVKTGQPLFDLKADSAIEFDLASFGQNGIPDTRWASTNCLPAHRVGLFYQANQMLATLISANTSAPVPQYFDTAADFGRPGEWSFIPLLGFAPSTATDENGETVTIYPDRLCDLSEFSPTRGLKEDLLAALGPSPKVRPLKILAEYSGQITVQDVPTASGTTSLKVINYRNDEGIFSQYIPACAVLYAEIDGVYTPLENGSFVTQGQPIGDFVERSTLRWSMLEGIIGEHLFALIAAFLNSVAIPAPANTPGAVDQRTIFYNLKYIPPECWRFAISSILPNGGPLEPEIFWDMRPLHTWYNPEINAYDLPPLQVSVGSELRINQVVFNLADPFASTTDNRTHGHKPRHTIKTA